LTFSGRIGLNGFLPESSLRREYDVNSLPQGPKPLTPDEVLLRRVGAPKTVPFDYYSADQNLPPGQNLPDSDLLKAIHAYASDFYSMATRDGGECDFRSFDETALLAMGILLEEAAADVLGENGDMVLVEPEGLENGNPEPRMTRYQVIGRVKPVATPEPEPESEEEVPEPEEVDGDYKERRKKKKKRRRIN